MIVDFKSIGHDFYGRVEQPVLTLKTPDGRVLSTVSNYYGLKPTFRFNDVSEVEFSVPAFYEGEKNNGYDDLIGLRLVEIEPFGDFILVNPVINNEGGRKETKTCKVYSLEYKFNYKQIDIPTGTYNFYNPVDNEDTIMQIIVEKMPDWSIGQVDSKLIGRWRTFDNVDENLYSFMMNTIQESYNCLFLFDTFNKKINVVEANRSAYNLPIYLSYNNLLKSVEVTELSDEIVTALSGYGSGDEVNISSVNPNGTSTIYNLDYFISNGDIPDALADKWVTYKDSLELYGQVSSNLQVLYLQKVNEREAAKATLAVLKTDYDALKTTYLEAQTALSSTDFKNDESVEDYEGYKEEYEAHVNELYEQLEAKQAEIDKQNVYIEELNANVEEVDRQINDIISACKVESYFTDDEYKVLSQYFIEDSIVDDTFVIPEYSSSILPDSSNVIEADNNGVVTITGAEVYASNIAEVFATDENGVFQAYTTDEESGEQVYNANDLSIFNEVELANDVAQTVADQLNNDARQKVYEFRGGYLELEYDTFEETDGKRTTVKKLLKGDVVNVDLLYNTDNLMTWEDDSSSDLSKAKFFMLTATLNNATYADTSYTTMNLVLQGMMLTDAPHMGSEFVKFQINSAVIYTTASNTEYQKQAVLQELYDYTYDSLQKLAFPSYEFSVDSGNFIFAQEFEPFKDKLELGCTINLTLDDDEDVLIRPILIEVSLNYDDETDFSITFSNKYRSSASEFQLADLITDMSRTSRSNSLNKADYKAYKDSQAGTQVDTLTTSALDVTRNKIVNSVNQSMECGSSGMFFRKKLSNGSFDDKQVGIINENIAFTKDGWKTVDIAIGSYSDENLGEGYGIIAPSIFGTLLAGENLVIENKVETETGDIVKQFKMDSTGAWLHNSSLAFTQEPDPDKGYAGGKLLIDPRYGIAAGNLNLFDLDGTEVRPKFWDTDENKIIWDENEVIETEKGSVYYVPLNSQFYFDINTGNAYFSGTISGKNIIAQTINGEAIKTGSLSGSAITDGTLSGSAVIENSLSGSAISDGSLELLNKLSDYGDVINAIEQYVQVTPNDELQQINVKVIGNLSAENFTGGKIIADAVDAENIRGEIIAAGSLISEKLIIEGENAKLAITPEYGIAAGNIDLFTREENTGVLNPSFMDEDGNLIIDSKTGAPLNSSFYFDINTGQAYFTGSLSASQITTGKLSSEYLDVKDAFITNAMIANLDAGKITTGTLKADIMQGNVISAINGYFKHIKGTELDVETVETRRLAVEELLTAGSILTEDINAATGNFTNCLTGVIIHGDLIEANTIKADSLVLKGEDGLYYKINATALAEDKLAEIFENTEEGQEPSVYNGIHGSALVTGSVTADRINVTDLFAQKITALGSISGGTFLQGRDDFKAEDGTYYTSGTYIGPEGVAFGDALIYDKKDNKLSIKSEAIDLSGKITFSDFKTSEDGSTGFFNHNNTTVIAGNRILTGSLGVGLTLDNFVANADEDLGKISDDLYGANGESVLKLDSNGDPIQATDKDGNLVWETVLDEDGDPIYELNESGEKIQDTNNNGNLIFTDDDGSLIYQIVNADGSETYYQITNEDTGDIVYTGDISKLEPVYKFKTTPVYEYEQETAGILTVLDRLDDNLSDYGDLVNN